LERQEDMTELEESLEGIGRHLLDVPSRNVLEGSEENHKNSQ